MPQRPDHGIPDGYVAVGRVLTTHGVKGDIKVQPLAPPGQLKAGKEVLLAGETLRIERSHEAGRFLHLKLSTIDQREDAAAHRDEYLLVAQADLDPPGEDQYYHFQLIGLRVVTTEGEDLGEIAEVFATPGNDVFVVRGDRGEVLIPAIDDVVHGIDLEAGRVTIEVVPGLLPDAKTPKKRRGSAADPVP